MKPCARCAPASLAISVLCLPLSLSAQTVSVSWPETTMTPLPVVGGMYHAGAGVAEDPPNPLQGERPRRARVRGALIGGGIGLVAGGVLGGLSVSSDADEGFGGSLVESAATAEAVMLGAVVGAGVGVILGATVFAPAKRVAPTAAFRSTRTSGSGLNTSGRQVRLGLSWRM